MQAAKELYARSLLLYSKNKNIKWKHPRRPPGQAAESGDSTTIKALRGGEAVGKNPTDRGRNGAKIHTIVDEVGIPLSFFVTAANKHDSSAVKDVLKRYAIHRPTYKGQYPRRTHCVQAAVYGYSI